MKKSEFVREIRQELRQYFNQIKKLHDQYNVVLPDEFITTGLTITQESVIKSQSGTEQGRYELIEYCEHLKAFASALKVVIKSGSVDYDKLSMLMDLKSADATTKAIARANELEKDFEDDVSSLISCEELKRLLKRGIKFSLNGQFDNLDFVDKMVDDLFKNRNIAPEKQFTEQEAEDLLADLIDKALEQKERINKQTIDN